MSIHIASLLDCQQKVIITNADQILTSNLQNLAATQFTDNYPAVTYQTHPVNKISYRTSNISGNISGNILNVLENHIRQQTDTIVTLNQNQIWAYQDPQSNSIIFQTGYVHLNNKVDAAQIIRKMIRENLSPAILRRDRDPLGNRVSPAELKARETLREMISESDWRRYITNGFIMVKGHGNKYRYQIFGREERIRVYEKGKHIHNLCIHSDKTCPPTDHVINMKLLAEIDEDAIWKGANKYGPSKPVFPLIMQQKTIIEKLKEMRTA